MELNTQNIILDENDEYTLEGDCGDSIILDKDITQKLIQKGKLATCKIKGIDKNNSPIIGTGFFCKIPLNDKIIKVLLTNNHILNENSISIGNIIKIIYQNEIKEIEITKERLCCTDSFEKEGLDFTCIMIFDSDNIEDFYEIEYPNNKSNYENDEICLIQYPKGGPIEIKSGHLKKIERFNIYHTVTTENESSGSPIIFIYRNYKVIGVHRCFIQNRFINLGIYIKNILEKINECWNQNYFNIRIMDIKGDIINLKVNNNTTIKEVKDLYSKIKGKNVNYTILYDGGVLGDNLTIHQKKIENNDQLLIYEK